MTDRLVALSRAGTSIWLDDLSRDRLIDSSSPQSLTRLIAEKSVVGVTTNPAIFSQAISNSALYADDIKRLATEGKNAESIITHLTVDDVQRACDQLHDVFVDSHGVDGRVSIEVDPRFARDTEKTIAQAKDLWQKVARPNVLIKVPATVEGLPAITELIAAGISVNVTIIFSVARYQEVFAAFVAGLERRHSLGLPLHEIHSVASFFVSRVDSEIDARLKSDSNSNATSLLGRAAIANARLAYEAFLEMKRTPQWISLALLGANIQRPLWASTGVKDKSYSDDRYVVELVAPETVNTMPQSTLDAVADHGDVRGESITSNVQQSRADVEALANLGISLDEVADKLEREGLEKFVTPWLQLIEVVEKVARGDNA